MSANGSGDDVRVWKPGRPPTDLTARGGREPQARARRLKALPRQTRLSYNWLPRAARPALATCSGSLAPGLLAPGHPPLASRQPAFVF